MPSRCTTRSTSPRSRTSIRPTFGSTRRPTEADRPFPQTTLMALLDVRDLSVSFDTADGVVQAVRGVSFSVDQGLTLGIVGESGSGKSVAVQTVVGLTRGARITGEVWFDDRDLLRSSPESLRHI